MGKTIRVDRERNRLFLTPQGFPSEEQAKLAVDKLVAVARSLRPGFGLIVDLRAFGAMTQPAAAHIERAGQELRKVGLGHVVRVVRDAVMASMQFERKTAALDYPRENAATPEAAEAQLDAMEAAARKSGRSQG